MQPKISQKLLVRSAVGLFALAALLFAFRYFKSNESDLGGNRTVDSKGMIAAIESKGDGQQVVVLKPDGSVILQPDVKPEVQDQDLAWRPDGNALFFASNRVGDKFTMFRWVPGDAPEQRAVGSRAQGSPEFLIGDADLHAEAHGLVIMGGKVMDYDPKKPSLTQVLPPVDPKNRVQISGDEEGSGGASPFEAQYANLGTSFRKAAWLPDKSAVVAVMRRENGEVLVYQKLNVADPKDGLPKPILAGDKVNFDIDQKSGAVYMAVSNFQWIRPEAAPEQFRKGSVLTTPYKHAILKFDPAASIESQLITITSSKDDKVSFGAIAIDPKGELLLLTIGKYSGEGAIQPEGLAELPLTASGGQMVGLVRGDVYEPSWSPSGDKIVFALRESDTSRAIMEVDRAGGTPIRKSPQEGVFSFPKYSPQTGS